MAIGAIISVISGAINIFNFASENLPLAHSDKSTVRIYAALASSETNAGGDIPKVFTYNERGDYMGESSRSSFDIFFGINDKVETGSFVDVEVPIDTDNVGQQATYALFKAGNDAVCVAYAAITWPDGTNYAWSGDWGKACGATWYWSNIYMDGSDNNNLDNTCIWIDADGNQPQTGFQIHWPEFVAQEGDEDLDPNYFSTTASQLFGTLLTSPSPRSTFPGGFWTRRTREVRPASQTFGTSPRGRACDRPSVPGMRTSAGRRTPGADSLIASSSMMRPRGTRPSSCATARLLTVQTLPTSTRACFAAWPTKLCIPSAIPKLWAIASILNLSSLSLVALPLAVRTKRLKVGEVLARS